MIFKIFNFPQKYNKRMYKRNKNNFLVFWARRGLILAPTYLDVNGESVCYVVLYEKAIWKNI